jgi:hypothetical protein
MRTVLMGVAAAVLAACVSQEATTVTTAVDREKHLYLEEVEGAEALAWVRSQNERTLAILENDARFKGYYEAALGIATSQARIPYGSIRKGYVYNFWQDETHERGLWRRTDSRQLWGWPPVVFRQWRHHLRRRGSGRRQLCTHRARGHGAGQPATAADGK